MNWLAILYDDHCGICSRIRTWLQGQASYVPIRLVPLHSRERITAFPGIDAFSPDEKLVIVSDDGSVWRGDGAWITLLWALRGGRELAFRLASPALRPLASRVVNAVSANRLRLSRWLRLDPDTLGPDETCAGGACSVRGEAKPQTVR